jgi:hypothetical protein
VNADKEGTRAESPLGPIACLTARHLLPDVDLINALTLLQSVKVSKVLAAYLASYKDPNLPIVLKMGDWTLPEHLTMAEIAFEHDRLLAFVAEFAGDAQNAETQTPVVEQPHAGPEVNPDATVMSLDQTTMRRAPSHTPSRQPLQPISRQVSVPLRGSPLSLKTPKREPDLDERASPTPTPIPSAANLSLARQSPQPSRSVARSSNAGSPATSRVKPSPSRSAASRVKRELPVTAEEEARDTKSRIPDDPFAATSQEDEAIFSPYGLRLKELTKETSTERLEASMQAGIRALDEVEVPLKTLQGNGDAASWLEQIETVRKQATRHRTVVGVVGNTGAGKSSVINAMLDEERLVPTNCMRACTAVVTEMSWSDSPKPESKYRAEVVFIEPEDWRKELKVLYDEVFGDEDGGFSKEALNPDSDAGIAYAKIRAVYFKHTKEQLANSTIDSLMRVAHVQNVLGTIKKIISRESSEFYRRLQHYVDSKEKGTEKKDKNGNKITNPKREFEYWPLIKVVKIYTKAKALSTGAVIVDLPGVHGESTQHFGF